MVEALFNIIRYEMKMTIRQTFAWLTPLLFFVMVIFLFSLSVDTDPVLLSKTAPGIIWVAALLAILISIGNFFQSDAQEGYLDLLLSSSHSLTILILCKTINHWLTHCLPLILVSPMLGVLLNLQFQEILTLVVTLLLGTPVFSLLGIIGAALTIGIRGHALLLPVLIIPLYLPILIFSTGAIIAESHHQPVSGYYAVMTAFILINLIFAPWLTAVALRNGVNQ